MARPFADDHLLPMASAIWSAAPAEMLSYPAAAFIRFHDNHGLLQLEAASGLGDCRWAAAVTMSSGLLVIFADRIRLNTGVREVRRMTNGVIVTDLKGHSERYDHVVMASHADQTLAMIADPSAAEQDLLGAFRYSRNLAVLHTDASFMPKRRAVWSSWNYIGLEGRSQGRRLRNLLDESPAEY